MSTDSAPSIKERRAALLDEIKRRPPLKRGESFTVSRVLLICGHTDQYTFYDWDFISNSRIEKTVDWIIRQQCENCKAEFEREMEELEKELAVKRQLDYEKKKAHILATDELERLREEVKTLCLNGEELFTAIELSTNDPEMQLSVFERVYGWHLAQLSHGVSGHAWDAVMSPVIARLNREHLRLLRAYSSCGYHQRTQASLR